MITTLDFSRAWHPDTEKQLDLLFGRRDGYVVIAVGRHPYYNEEGKYKHKRWEEKKFHWPTQREELLQWTMDLYRCDVYVCPTLRVGAQRLKEGEAYGRFLWADLDHDKELPPWITRCGGGILLSGSKSNRHVYVPLREWLDGVELAELNEGLAIALRGDSKWQHNSLLRLAGTENQKGLVEGGIGGGPGFVVWELLPHQREANIDEVRTRLRRVLSRQDRAGGTPASSEGVEAVSVDLSALPDRVRSAYEDTDHAEGRSGAHHRLVAACYDAGLTKGQTFSLIRQYEPSVDKYGIGQRLKDAINASWDKIVDDRQINKAILHGSTLDQIAEEIEKEAETELEQTRTHQIKEWDMRDLLKAKFAPIKWAIPQVLPDGATLLAGDPKSGKSFLVLQIALAIVTGMPVLEKLPIEQGDVLYAALEDGPRRIQTRAQEYLRGAAYDTSYTMKVWHEWNTKDKETGEVIPGHRRLMNYLANNPKTKLVIVDVLAKIRKPRDGRANEYDQDYQTIAILKRIADKFQVAILIVHHTNKGGDSKNENFMHAISGTQGLTGAADTIMRLKREEDTDEGKLILTGRDVESLILPLKLNRVGMIWEYAESALALHFPLGSKKRILATHISANPGQRPSEIAKALDEKLNTLKITLKRMRMEGYVRNNVAGQYFIHSQYAESLKVMPDEPLEEL